MRPLFRCASSASRSRRGRRGLSRYGEWFRGSHGCCATDYCIASGRRTSAVPWSRFLDRAPSRRTEWSGPVSFWSTLRDRPPRSAGGDGAALCAAQAKHRVTVCWLTPIDARHGIGRRFCVIACSAATAQAALSRASSPTSPSAAMRPWVNCPTASTNGRRLVSDLSGSRPRDRPFNHSSPVCAAVRAPDL